MEKSGTATQTKYDNMLHALCVLDNLVYTHPHSEYVIHIALPRQQCLRERALVLRSYANGLASLNNS